MINRRTFIRGAGAASLGASALSGFSQQAVTLKFHTFMAPNSTVWLKIHQEWMAKVERESNGRIKFEGYPAMQLGGAPTNLYDQAKDGVVDIIWVLPGMTAGRFPRTEVFELPFMTTNAESSSRAAWEYFETVIPDEFKDTKVLAFHTHGPGVLHSRQRPIRSAADLKGLKVRGPTRQATKMLAAAGAVAVGMPLPQIPDALVKGTIDAAALPWEVIPSVKVPELVKHHSEFAPDAGALYTSTFVMTMNKPRYESLPSDLKKVIDNNSGMATSGWMGRVQQDLDPVVRQSVKDRGNIVNVFGAAETAEFKRLTSAVDDEWIAEVSKRGFDGKKLFDTANSLIDKHNKRA